MFRRTRGNRAAQKKKGNSCLGVALEILDCAAHNVHRLTALAFDMLIILLLWRYFGKKYFEPTKERKRGQNASLIDEIEVKHN